MSPSPPTRFTLNLFFYQTRKGPVWYPGMLPRCGTKVCYRGVVSRCGTYRTPRTFFPLWWTYSCIAIFFMLCWLVFSSTMLILNSNRLFDIAMDPDTVDFSSFQATAASSRTWSPRLHTPPRGWLLMRLKKSKLTLRDKDWFDMSAKYLLVSHLGHRGHLKQLHRQLSLCKLFVSSVSLKNWNFSMHQK